MAQEQELASPPTQVDLDMRVKQFIALRDKKAALKEKHKEELAPIDELMDALESFIMQWLQTLNVNNVKTDAGTAYLLTQVSATVADADVFWTHVRDKQLWDLLDKRANKTAVTAYVEQHKVAPPGVNYSTMLALGVRRS